MAHPHHDDARRTQAGKLKTLMPGHVGEYPADRATRIAGKNRTIAADPAEALPRGMELPKDGGIAAVKQLNEPKKI